MQNFNPQLKAKLEGNKHSFTAKVEMYDMTGGIERTLEPEIRVPVISGEFKRIFYDPIQNISFNQLCPVWINNKIINFQTLSDVTSPFDTHIVYSDYSPGSGLAYMISADEGGSWSAPLKLPNLVVPPSSYKGNTPHKYCPVYFGGKIYFFYSWGGKTNLNDFGYGDPNSGSIPSEGARIAEIRCKVLSYDEINGVLTQEADIRLMQGEYVFHAFVLNNALYVAYQRDMNVIVQQFNTTTNTLTEIATVLKDHPGLCNITTVNKANKVFLAASINETKNDSKGRTYFYAATNATTWTFQGSTNFHVSHLQYNPTGDKFYALIKFRSTPGYVIITSITECKYWSGYEVFGLEGKETMIRVNDHRMVVENGKVMVYYISSSLNYFCYKRDTKVTYQDNRNTVKIADIPEERIRYVEWDYLVGDGVSRVSRIELSNTGEYFSKNGIDSTTQVPYSAIFSFPSKYNLVNKMIVLKIGDNQITDPAYRYETVFTGVLVNHSFSGNSLHLDCEDMLYLARQANVDEKKWEGFSATYLVGQLLDMAGVPMYEISPFAIEVDNLELDRRSTVLDNILEILNVSGAKMYCDRFGVVRTVDIVPTTKPVMTLTDNDFFGDITRFGPSTEQTKNRVNILTDSQIEDEDDEIKFITVEDKAAQQQMRRIATMEIDITPMIQSGNITEAKARQIGQYYLSKVCRTTTTVSGSIKGYYWLDVFDVVGLSITRPYTNGYFFMQDMKAWIGFHSDNLGYDFSINMMDT
ncbi:hypothetical protein [Paenibacillus contaminans]|uniref:Uncharacterized protein n=1 Tax=Paenibacillus contaminans TaxID=450362 RepID=A0A329MVT4_9BACL|nr:hypothetical protein [Paenibacillus contaminans]RAV22683.1 hypothetical protein DQG23_00230 [Paenibacillus contaminans]